LEEPVRTPRPITKPDLASALELRDLTDPAAGPHAMQLLIHAATAAVRAAWRCDVLDARGPRVVPIADNYDRLLIPADAVARDSRHARYVSEGTMLRSHTSATVPAALDDLALSWRAGRDVVLACPGIVYRRDVIDRWHTGTPHMIDLWRVTDRRRLGPDDLYEMIAVVIGALLPGSRWRTEPRRHPYTEHGLQVDVRNGGRWIEVGECGVAAPEVLAAAGLADGVTGLAMGIGLERVLMLRKGIDDIRLIRAADRRVSEQLLDLEPYRPVSTRPAISRDISIAVADDDDPEVLGDRLRDALGERAELLESVEVIAETPIDALPAAATERLGLVAGQKNVLVRLVLRALDRTLTDTDANELRDAAYAALHVGRMSR
jgi:phenylalanyl-tRNA synthetase alpha chain